MGPPDLPSRDTGIKGALWALLQGLCNETLQNGLTGLIVKPYVGIVRTHEKLL